MNLFHRHLLIRHLRLCGITLPVLMFVLLFVATPGEFFARQAGSPANAHSFGLIARLLARELSAVMPIALLIGTLFTVGDMARYQELTALGAAGWSRRRTFLPLLLVAAAATLLLAVLQIADWASAPGVPIPGGTGAADALRTPSAAEQTDKHARLAYPLVGFLSVLTAIPLASSARRVTVYSGFGTALCVVVIYYVVTAIFHALGRYGGLPPLVAGWLGPVLMAVAVALLWVKTRW